MPRVVEELQRIQQLYGGTILLDEAFSPERFDTTLRQGTFGIVHIAAHGHFAPDVLPSMVLLGFGAGIAFNPVLLAAMSDVDPTESGLASGVVNTAFMMGGALGLAALASIASSRTSSLRPTPHNQLLINRNGAQKNGSAY